MNWSSELAERLDVILFRLEMLASASGLPYAARNGVRFADGSNIQVRVETSASDWISENVRR